MTSTSKKFLQGFKSPKAPFHDVPKPKHPPASLRIDSRAFFASPRAEAVKQSSPMTSSRMIFAKGSPELRSFTSDSGLRGSKCTQESINRLKEVDKKTQESVGMKMSALHKNVRAFPLNNSNSSLTGSAGVSIRKGIDQASSQVSLLQCCFFRREA